MRLLFENWKRYLKEGDVIRGPWSGTPAPNPDLLNFLDVVEENLGKKLEDLYGEGDMDIPIEKFEQLGVVMREISALLNIIEDETGDDYGEN